MSIRFGHKALPFSPGTKLYHHSQAKAATAKGREQCADLFMISATTISALIC